MEGKVLSAQEIQAVANEIAYQLSENEKKPRRQIYNIVSVCGVEFSRQLLKDTLEIEANGGMMVVTGDRRRTPGGVFFQLARDRMEEEERERIFYTWRYAAKRRAAYESQFDEFAWEERAPIVEALRAESGKVGEVKIVMNGRPGKIERRQHLVVTTMQVEIPETMAFPAGVPQPSPEPVDYTVYMSAKQWEKVRKIVETTEEALIVEGMAAFDPETETIAVYSTLVTTKRLKRQEQKDQPAEKNQAKKPAPAKPARKPAPKPAQPKPAQPKPRRQEKEAPAAAPPPPPPPVEINIPDGMPPDAARKLTDLHTAAATYRQKIATIESQPEGQRFGLEMTQRLLKNMERQIETLENQYSKK